VVFGGFSAEALANRINDCQAKVVLTADGGFRAGKAVPLKKNVDDALEQCPEVEAIIVFDRCGLNPALKPGLDTGGTNWPLIRPCPISCRRTHGRRGPAVHLYTSGSTGKPKGVVHTTGGYLVHAAITTRLVSI
jgi:acetyl-CoA synthetase